MSEQDTKVSTDMKETKQCNFCQETVAAKATRCRFCHATLSNSTKEDGGKFEIVREETAQDSHVGPTMKINKVIIVIKDEMMKAHLRNYVPNMKSLFDKEPRINADELFSIMHSLRQGYAYNEHDTTGMKALLSFLEKEHEEQSKLFEEMKKEGVITFSFLQFLFNRGSLCFGYADGQPVGMEITDTAYAKDLFGITFVITGEVVKSNGERFYVTSHQLAIPPFDGVRSVEDLDVQPMNPDMLQVLKARGEKFSAITVGAHYRSYVGSMSYKTQFYTTHWKADGRIMIDGNSFNKMNPSYRSFLSDARARKNMYIAHGVADEPNSDSSKQIPEDMWFKTWPTVGGFSFSIKKWGEIAVDNVSDIQFDDQAYARLVLPQEKKLLIKSLVLHTENAFADVISGKGAGCIFLLHGNPGCGKTLTAEAIAELLHRPLYSVSVGELGTNTETLETKLRDILDVAAVWNAVILIDEADIFLEKRADNDIERNAMVGIFLRLLEYHQGVLFLTTNRVKGFDEAFHSRISVALKYEDLNREAREKVWRNFFEIANITHIDPVPLSLHNLNGRQIRNTIRLAQALAKSESVGIHLDHINRTVLVPSQFREDLKKIELEQRLEESKNKIPSPASGTSFSIDGGAIVKIMALVTFVMCARKLLE